MGKELWKPGNMLYPLPAVMVSLADQEGHPNIITLAWVGTVCTNPPMVSAIFLSDSEGDRRVCHQSDYEGTGLRHGLLRCQKWTGCG